MCRASPVFVGNYRGCKRELLSRWPWPDVGPDRRRKFDCLIEAFYNAWKPWLRSVTLPPSGFTNTEEEAFHVTKVVPFLVEDELKRLGGHYEKVGDWQSLAIADGHLITGQNPASSKATAQKQCRWIAGKLR